MDDIAESPPDTAISKQLYVILIKRRIVGILVLNSMKKNFMTIYLLLSYSIKTRKQDMTSSVAGVHIMREISFLFQIGYG